MFGVPLCAFGQIREIFRNVYVSKCKRCVCVCITYKLCVYFCLYVCVCVCVCARFLACLLAAMRLYESKVKAACRADDLKPETAVFGSASQLRGERPQLTHFIHPHTHTHKNPHCFITQWCVWFRGAGEEEGKHGG